MKSHSSPMGPVHLVPSHGPPLKGGLGMGLGPILWIGRTAEVVSKNRVTLDAVPRLGRRLAYCLYLGHHREGSRLQVCQAALA